MELNSKRIVLLVLLVCAYSLAAPLAFGLPTHETAPRTVTVIGEGTIEAKPDIATVKIGVESLDRDVHKALSASREVIGTIYQALVELGVADKDMQTANYSFNFERSSTVDTGSSRSTASARAVYRVNNMLTVTIRNLDLTGEIIDAAVIAGANQMWGVEFSIQEPEPIMREATELAVAMARERAEYLAALSALSVGNLISISESNGTGAPYLAARSVGSGVHPGEISFTARLTAVYELVP
jgi:uncharacterized protein